MMLASVSKGKWKQKDSVTRGKPLLPLYLPVLVKTFNHPLSMTVRPRLDFLTSTMGSSLWPPAPSREGDRLVHSQVHCKEMLNPGRKVREPFPPKMALGLWSESRVALGYSKSYAERLAHVRG